MTKTPLAPISLNPNVAKAGGLRSQGVRGEDRLFPSLEYSNFEFVSDFEIRISDLTNERFILWQNDNNTTMSRVFLQQNENR